MNRGFKTRFLLLLFAFIHVQSIKTTAVFVVSWLAGHCQYIQGKCDPDVIKRWDHKSFTINGLWPSDQFFDDDYGNFNLNLLKNSDFFGEINFYWPPQPQRGGKPYFLWQLQWRDHGSAFGDIVLAQYPKTFSERNITLQNEQIQLSYFKTSLTLYKNLNLTNMNTNSIKKSELAVRMNISQRSFYLICTQSGILRQIRVCINFYQTGAKAFECSRPNKFCNSVIVLKDWVNSTSKSQLEQEKKKVQLQKKKLADQQAIIMEAAWKKNEAPQNVIKEVPAQQKKEIQFYEQEVSEEQLKFDDFSEGQNHATIVIMLLLILILVGLCVFYLKQQSQRIKIQESGEIQAEKHFEMSSNQSKKESQYIFNEP